MNEIKSKKIITLDDIKAAVPSRKNSVTEELVEVFNASTDEPEFQGEPLLQTAMNYEKLMIDTKSNVRDYVNAIKFCAYLMADEDMNYLEAYIRTFKYRDTVSSRIGAATGSKDYIWLTSSASRYRKSPLVVKILTVSQIPFDLMFAGMRYKAIGVLADQMYNAKFDRDRISAADKLLLHTTGAEKHQISLEISSNESSAVDNLQAQLLEMATTQRELLLAGSVNLAGLGSMKPTTDYEEAEVV